VPADGEDLGAKAVSYGIAHMNGNRHLELGGRRGEGFDLLSRPLERSAEVGGLGLPFGCRRDSRSCSFQGGFVHRRRGYPHSRMDTALLDYELPEELIAQHPAEQRDASRLLVYRRATGAVDHRVFFELPELLAGELVVVNDTRVVPARLRLERETGGAVELLLVERCDGDGLWQGLVRPSRRVRTGERLGPVELLEELGDGRWLLRLEGEPAGEAPLPPYIRQHLDDAERYQTVYAREAGSAAAPTAGLHFTDELLQRVDHERVTLHVGLDTFRPIAVPQVEDHAIHGERYSVEQPAWERIASADRVLAVGTTCVRVLETVVRTGELAGRTSLFVTPGFRFRRVDALLTNFHLPRSTLLALVMAFAGVDEVRELYRLAAQERYRFYSFGDAMLIL
jgi:S-adenosylmethionine:tRNA ribosyltransferase-isomerase